jgi:MFS family permease
MASVALAEDPPRTARPWRTNLVFIWIGVFVGLLGANFVFPFVPFYMQELGVRGHDRIAYWTALSASATGLSLTLTAPLWGSLADRYGRKPMFMRALIGAGVLLLVMGVAQAAWQFVLLRFAMGAFAGTMGAAAALVAATTPRERVGYALGTLQTALFSANMLGPLVGGVVAASLGLRESFFFCGALYLAACALVFLFVRERYPEPAGGGTGGKPRDSGSLTGNLRAVVKERQVLLMLGLLFALWLSTTAVRPIMAISIDEFARHRDGLPDRVELRLPGWHIETDKEIASGLVFGALGLTSTLAALTVAPIGHRFGYRRTVATAAAGTGLLFLPVALAGSFTWFLLTMGLTGLFQGAMVPGTNALIAASTPDGKQGSAFGLAASMQSAALLLGPLLGGALSGAAGMRWVYVAIAALMLTAAAAATLLIREPRGLGSNPS